MTQDQSLRWYSVWRLQTVSHAVPIEAVNEEKKEAAP